MLGYYLALLAGVLFAAFGLIAAAVGYLDSIVRRRKGRA